ncbi:MAG TPA: hypothetical protein P5528_17115, partial [Steroidobacteraceae bacterium]|nr:hypothetical protein [Steroidobacteraceae bacterium]
MGAITGFAARTAAAVGMRMSADAISALGHHAHRMAMSAERQMDRLTRETVTKSDLLLGRVTSGIDFAGLDAVRKDLDIAVEVSGDEPFVMTGDPSVTLRGVREYVEQVAESAEPY